MQSLDSALLSAIFDPVTPDGRFGRDQLKALRKLAAKRKVVLLAFPPKAAGTFLRSAIIKAVDGQLVRVGHALGGRDVTPYLPTFVQYFSGGVTDKTMVGHAHMLALPANLHFLAAFAIRPIVITRNIPDMLASFWDMLETDDSALLEGLNCQIPANFRSLPRNTKADFLVDVLGPWFVNYYAGWLAFAAANPAGVCVIDYGEVKRDAAGVVERCLRHAGVARPREICEAAVRKVWEMRAALRFNKGVSGRGAQYFRPPHLHRLARMMGYYPVLAGHRRELLERPVQ